LIYIRVGKFPKINAVSYNRELRVQRSLIDDEERPGDKFGVPRVESS